MKSTKKGRASMKTIKKGLASGNRGRVPAPIQNLLQGRLDTWVIHLQKVDTLLMIGIYDIYFHFIPVIMVLYTYKYWFKMLKRWKFPPLIKARASSTNCTMSNLATQHTYIQSKLKLPRFISVLLYKSLTICTVFK